MSLTKASFSLIDGAFANVLDYGAVGDGTTDCVAAFESCRDDCIANNLTMFIPDGTFYLPGGVDLFSVHKIVSKGHLLVDADTEEIIIGSHATTAAADDIELFTTNGTIKVAGMENGCVKFHYAFKLYLSAVGTPTTGGGPYHAVAYSNFHFTSVGHIHLNCNRNGGVVAWINENVFYCGRIEGSVTFDGDYNMNNNIFYGVRGDGPVFTFDIGSNNHFYDCRLEGSPTATFADSCFNNILYANWANFSYVGMYDRDAATWTITDPSGTNGVVQTQDLYTDKQTVYEIGPYTKGYPWSVFESDGATLTVRAGLATFYDTGLVILDKPIWFVADSDSVSFNVFVEAYDSTGTKITGADPGIVTDGLTWNSTFDYYDVGGAIVNGREFAIAPASGVAFYKVWIRTAGGSVIGNTMTYFRINVTQFNNNYKIRKVSATNFGGLNANSFSGTTAPTYGLFSVGDVVTNSSPAAGQPQGWVCTVAGSPGTWKAMANLV